MSDFRWYTMVNRSGLVSDHVKTDKMVELIEKYGVNAVDGSDFHIYDLIGLMTKEQIDLVFDKYKMNVCINDNYVFYHVLGLDKTLYILEKCLALDYDYKYLTHKVSSGIFRFKYTLKEILTKGSKEAITLSLSPNDYKRAFIMIENHEKRGMTFFQVMMSKLVLISKKQRN